jgi:hypothetical protein
MKSDQDKLGTILYTHGNKHICEGGISDGKKTILWEEIESLFWDASKHTLILIVIPIPTYESQKMHIVNSVGDRLSLTQSSPFRIGSEKKEDFWNLYQFIVSKIIDRQWSELIRVIEKGERISFHSFDITSTAIYRKKFRGYDIIGLHRVVGCEFNDGQFLIKFVDEKERPKNVSCGLVSEIPNVHLAQAFLSPIARQNLSH